MDVYRYNSVHAANRWDVGSEAVAKRLGWRTARAVPNRARFGPSKDLSKVYGMVDFLVNMRSKVQVLLIAYILENVYGTVD